VTKNPVHPRVLIELDALEMAREQANAAGNWIQIERCRAAIRSVIFVASEDADVRERLTRRYAERPPVRRQPSARRARRLVPNKEVA
jgi:hypothetical protein